MDRENHDQSRVSLFIVMIMIVGEFLGFFIKEI